MEDYQNGVCIFIDILGTRANRSFAKKKKIHSIFHGEIKNSSLLGHDHTVFSRKIISFSDCAYFFYFYKENISENRKDDERLMDVALRNISTSIMLFYKNGFIVRGGACFGKYYLDELGFFGPAVEKAYELESKLAIMPRILLEENFGKRLYELEKKHNHTRNKLINKDDNSYSLNEFFYIDSSSTIYLNNAECEELHIESILGSIFRMNRECHDENSGERVKEKYAYLMAKANIRKSHARDKIGFELRYAARLLGHLEYEEIIKLTFMDREELIYDYFDKKDLHKIIDIFRLNAY